MSDDNKGKTVIDMGKGLPPQKSATDTSNWDNKVSTDPSGAKYIRTDDGEAE